jgi:A/G-specific adenine glycosylase
VGWPKFDGETARLRDAAPIWTSEPRPICGCECCRDAHQQNGNKSPIGCSEPLHKSELIHKVQGLRNIVRQRAAKALTQALLKWFGRHARALPWRKTTDPYAIWVSEIMLQQTQVATVIPYYERWMKRLPRLEDVSRAPEEVLLKLWEGLGYYTRVRNIQKAARAIVEEHGGEFPRDYDAVLSLAGIGRYTAGAISSIAFDRPRAAVDGNVVRVLSRTLGISGDPKSKEGSRIFWAVAQALANASDGLRSKEFPRPCSSLTQALMELGAMICAPRSPACGQCPVANRCYARKNGKILSLPMQAIRPEITRRRVTVFVLRHEEALLVRQRPEGVVNGSLWEFPNLEDARLTAKVFREITGSSLQKARPLLEFTHSITRYRIAVKALGGNLDAARATLARDRLGGQWLTREKLQELPFSSAHKRILGSC